MRRRRCIALLILCTSFGLHSPAAAEDMTTYGFGWSTEGNVDPIPSFIAVHRWLLSLHFEPTTPPPPRPEFAVVAAAPNEEVFYYRGTYKDSPRFLVLLDVGGKSGSEHGPRIQASGGIRVQITAPSITELEEFRQQLLPFLDEAKRVTEAAKGIKRPNP